MKKKTKKGGLFGKRESTGVFQQIEARGIRSSGGTSLAGPRNKDNDGILSLADQKESKWKPGSRVSMKKNHRWSHWANSFKSGGKNLRRGKGGKKVTVWRKTVTESSRGVKEGTPKGKTREATKLRLGGLKSLTGGGATEKNRERENKKKKSRRGK